MFIYECHHHKKYLLYHLSGMKPPNADVEIIIVGLDIN